MGEGALAPHAPVVGRLGKLLGASGYMDRGVEEALAIHASLHLSKAELPVLRRRLSDLEPLCTLVELFLIGVWVGGAEAARALAPLSVVELEAAGLLEIGTAGVRSVVRISAWETLILAHDREEAGQRADQVVGVGPATKTLAAITIRRRVASALDVGTGCGVQALLEARYADRVVAVDVNPHALVLAELNARLNGVTNVELRRGSFFEPVEGSRFDLVVANPPFVISPDVEYVFRDGVEPRDGISRAVISEVPRFLREGGYAHVLCNWIHRPDEDWSIAPRAWVEGSGCDAWILHYRSDDPLTYAATWNEPLRDRDPAAFSTTLERWLDHYREEGIDAIATGAVILRRRTGPNWARADEMPYGPSGAAGGHVLRVFEAQRYLEAFEEDRTLLGEVFRPADGHRLEQTLIYRDGEYAVQGAYLLLEDGVGIPGQVDPNAVQVLLELDGRRPLGELVAEVADESGLSMETLTSDVLRTVRRLVGLGFVYPVGQEADAGDGGSS